MHPPLENKVKSHRQKANYYTTTASLQLHAIVLTSKRVQWLLFWSC